MSFAVVVLVARIGLVLALYLFLWMVVRGMSSDLRHITRSPASRSAKSAAPVVKLQLVVLAVGQTDYQVGQRFVVQSPMMLGRDPACDLPVEDDFVSAQHLKIVRTNGVWLAQDLNSTNGTRINGNRLQGTATLKPGDMLELGRLRMRLAVEP